MAEINELIQEIKGYFTGGTQREIFVNNTFLGLSDRPSAEGISPRQIKLYGSQTQIQLYDWMNKYNLSLAALLDLIKQQIDFVVSGAVYRLYIAFNFTFNRDEYGSTTLNGTATPTQLSQIEKFINYQNPKLLYVMINGDNYLANDIQYLEDTNEYLISCLGITSNARVQSASIRIDADINSSTYSLITGYHFKEIYKSQIVAIKSEIDTINERIDNECLKYYDVKENNSQGIVTITLKGEK